MNYSRNMLLSLHNCWKFGNQLNEIRHASSPLSKCVWKDLKLLNLFVPTRGKCYGRQHVSTVVKKIPVLPPSTRCDRPRNHLNATRFGDTRNLLNIQAKPFDRNASSNALTRDEFVPSILLSSVMLLVPKMDKISVFISENNLDLLFLTDSWLNNAVEDTHELLPNYNLSYNLIGASDRVSFLVNQLRKPFQDAN